MRTNGMTTVVSNLHSDNLLSSLTVFGRSLTAIEIETGPLSDVVSRLFFGLPLFLFPATAPCTIIYADHMSEPS